MKQLKTLFIAIVMFFGAQVATAQTKVGHIDVSTLMTTMPAMKAAEAQLTKLREGYDVEYKKLVSEYQTKAAKYQQEAETAGDVLNQTRSQEMQDMGARIQKYQDDASKSLQDKQVELQKPLFEKALAAIKKVSDMKGLSYVLDSTSPGTVLHIGAGNIDIMADVKKELGF
ncbi:OmpH family outer membrane protein [Flavobacterium difficile]|uniref:OmpH family outer membrane protein n=1 Tax=Flavobacterium difficile TaxID=2709659 RepID=A0ABX0IBX3_9FLAO|nr:OmpH family outer membrane protein [Flavobacterium difficile]NHM02881.1 OmpH family outer membrane protein [Flavobacterium difficile]